MPKERGRLRSPRHLIPALLLSLPVLPSYAQVSLTETKGAVLVTKAKTAAKSSPAPLPYLLKPGDLVETGEDGSAQVVFAEGARVKLSPKTRFALETKEDKAVLDLQAGRVKAWVQGALKNRFEVRTAAAVCAVRGTEFDVEWDKDMLVEVFDGLIAVRDLIGNEVLVASGERLRVVPGKPLERPERMEGKVAPDPKSEIRREVALGMSKDAVQAAAAQEARLAEYQEGKTLIDVSGNRVRLEEYVVRPAADTFKLVVLNERESRFDYFYYQGKFNKALPADLSTALKDVDGKIGADAPMYYLTAYESGRSNTQDTIAETGAGGHLTQTTLADPKTVYHPDTDSFETAAAGSTFWETLFDNYSYKVNGTEWFGWEPLSGSNIAAYDYTAWRTRIAGSTLGTSGAAISCSGQSDCLSKEGTLRASSLTQPDGSNLLHDRVEVSYKASLTGPVLYSEKYDFYVIDDQGKVATPSDFSGVLSGKSYLDTLVKFNYEQVITASTFEGRSIDLVVEPKILIRSGLLE